MHTTNCTTQAGVQHLLNNNLNINKRYCYQWDKLVRGLLHLVLRKINLPCLRPYKPFPMYITHVYHTCSLKHGVKITPLTWLRTRTPSCIGCGRPANDELSFFTWKPTNFARVCSRNTSRSFCLKNIKVHIDKHIEDWYIWCLRHNTSNNAPKTNILNYNIV